MTAAKVNERNLYLLKSESAVKIYKEENIEVAAIRGITKEFASGKIHLIFGPSGSGKSTFLRILSGMEECTSGSILFNDQVLKSPEQLTQFRLINVSFVFQEPNLISFFNVKDNLKFPLIARGLPADQERLGQVLRSIDLTERAASFPDQLSTGEKQRLSFGMAMMKGGVVLIADEPTGSLDEKNKENIMKLFVKYKQDHPEAIIIIATHDMAFQTIADEILLLKFGLLDQIIDHKDTIGLKAALTSDVVTKRDVLLKQEQIRQKLKDIEKLMNDGNIEDSKSV